jgi:hypothetical protein
MAIVMKMFWAGLKQEHYEAVRRETKFETNAPRGGKYHVAWVDGAGLHVVDVWESAQLFEEFVQTRLMPAAQKHGLPGEPKVEIAEAYNTFAPNP